MTNNVRRDFKNGRNAKIRILTKRKRYLSEKRLEKITIKMPDNQEWMQKKN